MVFELRSTAIEKPPPHSTLLEKTMDSTMDALYEIVDLFPVAVFPLEVTYLLREFIKSCATVMERVYCTMSFNVQENRIFDPLPIEYRLETLHGPAGFDCDIRLVHHVPHGNGPAYYGEGDEVFFSLEVSHGWSLWGTPTKKSIKMPTPDPKSYKPSISPAFFLIEHPELAHWLVDVWEAEHTYHEFREADHWDAVQAAVDDPYLRNLSSVHFVPQRVIDAPIPEDELDQAAIFHSIEECDYWLNVDEDMRHVLGNAFIPDWKEVADLDDIQSDIDDNDDDEEEWIDSDEYREARASWAQSFVASLEKVDLCDIPMNNRKCPGCWLDFGDTDEFDEFFEAPPLPEDANEAETVTMFQALPFDARRPNNDAVKTPCGHLFGHDCLITSLTANSSCPICRRNLRT